jgi:hypothetical protein
MASITSIVVIFGCWYLINMWATAAGRRTLKSEWNCVMFGVMWAIPDEGG